MSSYYTTAQLEAMRKAKLLKELEDSIEALKRQLAVKAENAVQESEGSGLRLTVMNEDMGQSGYLLNTEIPKERCERHKVNGRRELDFSAFLEQPSPKADRLKEERLEYQALCRLLEREEKEWLPEEMEPEMKRMRESLEKRRQDEYIAETLAELMKEMGCTPRENTILDHTEGQLFAVDGSPLCDVFMGVEKSGILFEPVAQDRGGSLERRRQIENSAGNICSMYQELEERAAEKGILLRRVYQEPVDMANICVQADIRRTESQKQRQQQKKGRTQLRAMEAE